MTGNKEDYLKIIYDLGGDKIQVSNKDIAKGLHISAPSVSEMIKKLLEDGYVEYQLYKGVKLTEYGLREARRVKRKHLLWEVFLVEKLGYEWDEVHEEAEKLEHVTSKKLEELLEKYLDYPKVCPHGSDIINSGEESLVYRTMENLPTNKEATIKRFTDERKLLNYASMLGLKIGDKIEIMDIGDDKTVTIKKDREIISIEKQYTRKIYVY